MVKMCAIRPSTVEGYEVHAFTWLVDFPLCLAYSALSLYMSRDRQLQRRFLFFFLLRMRELEERKGGKSEGCMQTWNDFNVKCVFGTERAGSHHSNACAI